MDEMSNSAEMITSRSESVPSSSSMQLSLREIMISSKYHFARGSSRFMFSYATQQVIEELQKSSWVMTNIDEYIYDTVL